jgi:hypothetical protein
VQHWTRSSPNKCPFGRKEKGRSGGNRFFHHLFKKAGNVCDAPAAPAAELLIIIDSPGSIVNVFRLKGRLFGGIDK